MYIHIFIQRKWFLTIKRFWFQITVLKMSILSIGQKKANTGNFIKACIITQLEWVHIVSVYVNWLHMICFGWENVLNIWYSAFYQDKKKSNCFFPWLPMTLMNTLKWVWNNKKKTITSTILQVEVIAYLLLLHLLVPQPGHWTAYWAHS